MSTGNLTRNPQEFFLNCPTNEKAARVSQTQTAFENTTTDPEFTENSSKSHLDAPIVYVVAKRNPSGFWPLHITFCPYCAGEHWHGGGSGETALLGHRTAHCVMGTPGYILEVQP